MKSHVSLGQTLCPICCRKEDSGEVLLNTRLQPTLDKHTTTGWGMCSECKQKDADGYIALIELSGAATGSTAKLEDTLHLRTGNLLHIRRTAFERIFDVPIGENKFVFVEPAVVEKLKSMIAEV